VSLDSINGLVLTVRATPSRGQGSHNSTIGRFARQWLPLGPGQLRPPSRPPYFHSYLRGAPWGAASPTLRIRLPTSSRLDANPRGHVATAASKSTREPLDPWLHYYEMRGRFIGLEITINADEDSRFCATVDNGAEAFTVFRAPDHWLLWTLRPSPVGRYIIDFISFTMNLTPRQGIIQATFLNVIDGDLLKLVRLSSGFKMMCDQSSLRVGDTYQAEGRNKKSGKTATVKGNAMRQGKPVIKVISVSLYTSRSFP
jgi:hypothetical protein